MRNTQHRLIMAMSTGRVATGKFVGHGGRLWVLCQSSLCVAWQGENVDPPTYFVAYAFFGHGVFREEKSRVSHVGRLDLI